MDMVDKPQKSVSPIWHSDIPGMLIFFFPMLLIFLMAVMVPITFYLGRNDPQPVYLAAVLAGATGVVLLFFARLPLYRQRRYFTFGSRHLDAVHRRLYRLAYVFVTVSFILLVTLLLALGR